MQGFRLGDPGQQHYWDSHSFPLTKRQLLVLRCYYVEWYSLPRGGRRKWRGREREEGEEGLEQGKKKPEGGRDYVPPVKASWKNKPKQETSSHRSLVSQMTLITGQSLASIRLRRTIHKGVVQISFQCDSRSVGTGMDIQTQTEVLCCV